MWITVFLVFLTVIFSCSTQEVTNFDAQTVTDTTQSNQGVKWDSTGPSVTLSIRDGRSNSVNKPPNETPNHPLHYSNEWQPFLMPIGFNNYGYANGQVEEGGEDSLNYPFVPTVLRRSNSDPNNTSSRQFENGSGFVNTFSPVPMPITPFPQMYFYPHQLSQYLNGNADTAVSNSVLQNSTAPTARSTFSDADATSLRDDQKEVVPSPYFSMLPDIPYRYHPMNFYRNGNGFIPPPAFAPPYPILPNANENYLHPLAYQYVNSPLYGRQIGSDGIESNNERQNVPVVETLATSGDIQEHDRDIANGTPSDPSSTFVPPQPFPLQLGAFPFGVLPPPILPPAFPNPAAAAGLPIRPLVENVNLPKDGLVADVIASQSPLSPDQALESPARLIPPENTLLTDVPITSGIDINVGESVPEEQPNQAKIPYEFGFDMNDGKGTDQHRKEVSDVTGTVRGSYGYRDMFGVYRLVNYIADKNGFRAVIKSNEPGVASSGSANVVVMAEQPPPQAIAEGQRIEPEAIIVPDTATDLIAEGSAITAK